MGLVIGSLIKLWSAKVNQDILNIIHIHLNDTSDEATIDVHYLTSHDDIIQIQSGDFTQQEFKKDASGIPLRYKILIYGM